MKPICTTIMTVFVTSAQLRDGSPKSPDAFTRMHRRHRDAAADRNAPAMSPEFMSMATMLPNGGFSSGKPRGPGSQVCARPMKS